MRASFNASSSAGLLVVCLAATSLSVSAAGPPDAERRGPAAAVERVSVPSTPRPWYLHPIDARGDRVVPRRNVAARRHASRKKAVLIGTAIGGAVGLGGGIYASKATGGDTDPWGVPGLAALGAGIGAAAGFIVSLF